MDSDNCRQTPWPTYADGRAFANEPSGLAELSRRIEALPVSVLEHLSSTVWGTPLRTLGEDQHALHEDEADMYEGLDQDEMFDALGSQYVTGALSTLFESYPLGHHDLALRFDGVRWHAQTMRTPHFGASDAWDDVVLLRESGIADLPLDGPCFADDVALAVMVGLIDDVVDAAVSVGGEGLPTETLSRLEAVRHDLNRSAETLRTLLDHFERDAQQRAWARLRTSLRSA